MATLRLPSGEMRMVRAECRATVGVDRQRRSPERQDRQGRPQASHGRAPADARHRDEPGRPPARRRRGLDHAGPPSGHPVGRADARLPHAQEEQGVRPLHRPRPPPRKKGKSDEPFEQEGPVGRGAPDGAHRGHERAGNEDDGQDLVARLDDLPGDGRPHDRRPRRAQARARLRVASRWSATSSASSRRRALFRGHAGLGEGPMADETEDTQDEKTPESTETAATEAPKPKPPRQSPRRRRSREPAAGRPRRQAEDRREAEERRGRGAAPKAEAEAPRRAAPGPRPSAADRPRPRRPRPAPQPRPRKPTERGPAPGGGRSSAPTPSTSARPPARRGSSATTSAASRSTRRARSSPTRPRARRRRTGRSCCESPSPTPSTTTSSSATTCGSRGQRRRGPDPQALPPARHGPRDAHPQAHQPPHDHAHAEGARTAMGQKVHPESMRVGYIHDWKSNWFNEKRLRRLPRRGHPRSATTSRASSRTPASPTSRSARTPTRSRSTSTRRARAS